jgi:hypothetical protein
LLTHIPKIKALYSYEILVPALEIAWCNEPEDYNIYVSEIVLESPSEIRAKNKCISDTVMYDWVKSFVMAVQLLMTVKTPRKCSLD